MDAMDDKVTSSDKATFMNGCWFVFEYAGHSIELWMSSVTGMEAVRIDGVVVERTRSWRKMTYHDIEVAGHALRVSLHVDSILKGPVYAVLSEQLEGRFHPIAAKRLRVYWGNNKAAGESAEKTPREVWIKRLSNVFTFGISVGIGIFLAHHFEVFSWQFFGSLFLIMILAVSIEHWLKSLFGRSRATVPESDMQIENLPLSELPIHLHTQADT